MRIKAENRNKADVSGETFSKCEPEKHAITGRVKETG